MVRPVILSGAKDLSLVCRPLLTSLSLFLLASCAVGPNYSGPPADSLPARFKNAFVSRHRQTDESKGRAPIGTWWRIFHDSNLDNLEKEACSANQDLHAAVARLSEARAETRVAAADFFPSVNFDPAAQRQRTSNTLPFQRGKLIGPNPFGGATPSTGAIVLNNQPLSRTYDLFRVPADLNWEIDLFGRVRRSLESARASAEANEADLQNLLLALTANVATDYFSLRALDAEIAVIEATIKTRRDALEIAQERLQAGLTGELDVVRAQSDLAQNESSLVAAERARGDMENSLATLLGRNASSFHLAPRPALPVPPQIPAGLPSQLLERRPDVASAERQLAAANARIGIATAAFFPQIRLTGAGGFESADLGLLFQGQSSIWQIGPSITLPIFQGGRNVANLQAARARYDEGLANYRKQVLVAFQEVESALNDLRTLASEAEAQGRATGAARRALELSQQQYDKGAVDFVDVLDAQRTLLPDERLLAQLSGQCAEATVQLVKALGGDWK